MRDRGWRGSRSLFPLDGMGCKWVRGSGCALDDGGQEVRFGVSGCSCWSGATARLAGDSCRGQGKILHPEFVEGEGGSACLTMTGWGALLLAAGGMGRA